MLEECQFEQTRNVLRGVGCLWQKWQNRRTTVVWQRMTLNRSRSGRKPMRLLESRPGGKSGSNHLRRNYTPRCRNRVRRAERCELSGTSFLYQQDDACRAPIREHLPFTCGSGRFAHCLTGSIVVWRWYHPEELGVNQLSNETAGRRSDGRKYIGQGRGTHSIGDRNTLQVFWRSRVARTRMGRAAQAESPGT